MIAGWLRFSLMTVRKKVDMNAEEAREQRRLSRRGGDGVYELGREEEFVIQMLSQSIVAEQLEKWSRNMIIGESETLTRSSSATILADLISGTVQHANCSISNSSNTKDHLFSHGMMYFHYLMDLLFCLLFSLVYHQQILLILGSGTSSSSSLQFEQASLSCTTSTGVQPSHI